jgi:hypothetical protein
MSAIPETITDLELEQYFQRRQAERNVMGGASSEAARIVQDILAHREPEFVPGAMYRDADGTNWLYAPGLAVAREGSWADCPWLKPGDHGAFSLGSPARPLRRLVPEGSHEAAATLVAEWRGLGEQDDAVPAWRGGYRAALRKCADELEYALKAGSGND